MASPPGLRKKRKQRNKVKATASPLTVVEVPIDDLRTDPANPRRISDAQIEALTRSLQEFGFVQPVLARREDKMVIGGHQRLTAARRLGYKTAPVTFLDISLEQARLLNLGLNKISGDWDQELLARLLADLSTEDMDRSLSGFADDEVSELLKSLEQAREARAPGVVRPERRAGGRTGGTTRPTWRTLGVGRPPPALRRCLRHSRRFAPLRGQAGSDVLHRPTVQREPWGSWRTAARLSQTPHPERRHAARRMGGILPALVPQSAHTSRSIL